LSYNRELIDLGLSSPYKILMEEDPDLTAEEAIVMVEDNLNRRNEMFDKIRLGASIVETTKAIDDANS